MKYLFAIFALGLLAPMTHACSCARSTPQEVLRRAELVFAGRVEETTLIDESAAWEPRVIVRMSVGRVWKGRPSPSLTMHTNLEASSCRGLFRELARSGQELLVFATAGKGADWKSHSPPFDDRHPVKVLRQDLVDALPGDATIYTTSICSGTAPWKDAAPMVHKLADFIVPKGARVMNDPPRIDDSHLPPELRGLPEVCRAMRSERDWKALDAPPPEGADFEHELRRTAEYKQVMSGSIGQAKDFWWRDHQTGAAGLCRLMDPDPRECGALSAVFEGGKIVFADSDPCARGPM